LNNSTGTLLVENTVPTLSALDHIPRLQSVLLTTISADVSNGFGRWIHDSTKKQYAEVEFVSSHRTRCKQNLERLNFLNWDFRVFEEELEVLIISVEKTRKEIRMGFLTKVYGLTE